MASFSLSRNAATAERMRARIAFLGHTPNGHPVYNQQETSDLVQEHPNYPAVLRKLTRRTRSGVGGKASRMRITRPRGRPWTDPNEIGRLRKVYPTGTREQILAAFPGRSYAAVAKAANARGIYRAPSPYKPTGDLVLDQILQRARARNWTMTELDDAVRGTGYFARRRWRNGRFNQFLHGKALEQLGGRFRARWFDEDRAA